MKKIVFLLLAMLTAFSLSFAFILSSCSVFDLYDDGTIDGKYFLEEGSVFHFQDNCFFVQRYPMAFDNDYSDYAELSCLVQESSTHGEYCIFIGVPKECLKVRNNRLSFTSICPVTVCFLTFATHNSDMIGINSKHTAIARFSGSAQLPDSADKLKEDKGVYRSTLRLKLSLDDGNRLLLHFNSLTNDSIM